MSKNNNEVYAITNLEGYATEMREAAANFFCDSSKEDLDSYISLNQMMSLIRSECIGFDDENRPLLNEDANEQIYESTVTWINNVGLAKLASQGYVECAWDDQRNEMVFWANKELDDFVKHGDKKSNEKPSKRRNNKKNKGS